MDYEERAPGREGGGHCCQCAGSVSRADVPRRAAGSRQAGGLWGSLCRGLTLLGTLNHLPGAAFPKAGVGPVTRACLLLHDFRFYISQQISTVRGGSGVPASSHGSFPQSTWLTDVSLGFHACACNTRMRQESVFRRSFTGRITLR